MKTRDFFPNRELLEIREGIDLIDEQLVELLAKRADLVIQAIPR